MPLEAKRRATLDHALRIERLRPFVVRVEQLERLLVALVPHHVLGLHALHALEQLLVADGSQVDELVLNGDRLDEVLVENTCAWSSWTATTGDQIFLFVLPVDLLLHVDVLRLDQLSDVLQTVEFQKKELVVVREYFAKIPLHKKKDDS